jgi:NitT/TauT family transport system substrate-binding protein
MRLGRGTMAALALLIALNLACARQAEPAPARPDGAAATGANPADRPTPAPLDTLNVAFAADAAVYAPMFIAIDKGYFAEQGIEIEIVKAGGGVATPALISGEMQYSTSAAAALSAMLLGAPLKIIYTNADKTNYGLYATTPDVRTLGDLVGKTVGVQSRGDTMEIAARMALAQNGVDPDAVSYLAVGVGPQRLGAMQAGSVAGVVLSVADAAQAEEAGIGGTRLSDIKNEVRMSWMGAATSEHELQANPERVKRFLHATAQGREYFRAFRDESIDILTKYNEKPRSTNEVDYDETIGLMTDDGTMAADVQQRDAQVRAGLNGVPLTRSVDDLYDYRPMKEVYQELRASGWKPTR